MNSTRSTELASSIRRREVWTFDYDGSLAATREEIALCIGTTADGTPKTPAIVSSNAILLASLVQKIEKNPETPRTVMNFSLRNDKYVDEKGEERNGNGSAFVGLHIFHQHLTEIIKAKGWPTECTLDGCLLAEVYSDQEFGRNFAAAIQGKHTGTFDFDCHIQDISKLTITYLQMQYIASKYPEDMIDFYCWDDLNTEVLDRLIMFFETHPSFIPANVCLHFNWYLKIHESDITLLSNYVVEDGIQGTGKIDKNYRETIKEMTQIIRSEANLPSYKKKWSKEMVRGVPHFNAIDELEFCPFYLSELERSASLEDWDQASRTQMEADKPLIAHPHYQARLQNLKEHLERNIDLVEITLRKIKAHFKKIYDCEKKLKKNLVLADDIVKKLSDNLELSYKLLAKNRDMMQQAYIQFESILKNQVILDEATEENLRLAYHAAILADKKIQCAAESADNTENDLNDFLQALLRCEERASATPPATQAQHGQGENVHPFSPIPGTMTEECDATTLTDYHALLQNLETRFAVATQIVNTALGKIAQDFKDIATCKQTLLKDTIAESAERTAKDLSKKMGTPAYQAFISSTASHEGNRLDQDSILQLSLAVEQAEQVRVERYQRSQDYFLTLTILEDSLTLDQEALQQNQRAMQTICVQLKLSDNTQKVFKAQCSAFDEANCAIGMMISSTIVQRSKKRKMLHALLSQEEKDRAVIQQLENACQTVQNRVEAIERAKATEQACAESQNNGASSVSGLFGTNGTAYTARQNPSIRVEEESQELKAGQ